MPFDIKILSDKIKKIKESFENGKFGDALSVALNAGNGLMQQRIFNDNLDIDGNGFGVYIGEKRKQSDRSQIKSLFGTKSKTDKKRIKASAGLELTYYQRKRAQKGRQILKKDLEFFGGLRRSPEVVIENEKEAALQFNTIESAKIAKGQEAQITNIRNGKSGTTKGTGVKIFTFNDEERKNVTEQGALLIKEILFK